MKTLLVTGFDPFGGESINPAWEAVKRLPAVIGGWQLHILQVPTVFTLAAEAAAAAAEQLKPDAVLCIGQAGGRAAVTPELVAINYRYASIPDNAGNQPAETPVIADAPDAYFATVPVRQMADAIRAAGYPAAVSYSAGAFVCNDLLFRLLHRYHGTDVRVGFIHVPYLPQQVKAGDTQTPSMPLEEIVGALQAAIAAL